MWNMLDLSIRNIDNLNSFKDKLSKKEQVAPCYFNVGVRKLNILHSRLRNICSNINADLYRVNIVQSTMWQCFCPIENMIHCFFECPLYNNIRQELFNNVSKYGEIDIDLLLKGSPFLTDVQNQEIFVLVHQYINKSNRF